VETRNKVLREKVGGMETERAESAIFHVLQQHHIQQKIQLEEQFRSEMKAAQDEERAIIAEQRQQEKDELVAAHEKVVQIIGTSFKRTIFEINFNGCWSLGIYRAVIESRWIDIQPIGSEES
jgi:hypothetical protein